MDFTIYTDGGCSGNKRDAGCRGAWAYIIIDPAGQIINSESGIDFNTTNNRMEMMAVIEGLSSLIKISNFNYGGSKIHNCTVITDSKYVINNFEDYIPEWKKNGWKKSGGGSVVNIDLWKEICSLSPEFKSFQFKWVKGHSTNKFNQEADALVRSLLY
jgi:ribonuclease HI